MKRYTVKPNKKGAPQRERTKGKISNNAFLRYSFCVASSIVIPAMVYINLNVARTNIHLQPNVVFKEKLEEFHGISSRKQPAKGANNNTTTTTTSNKIHVEETKQSDGTAASSVNDKIREGNLVLTAYLEPPETLIETGNTHEPFVRNTSSTMLRSVSFPNASDCATLMRDFPVDDFPLDDPFLPWIHDYVPSLDGKSLHFVAQNRRKCDTGKSHTATMEFWSPQVALFQGVPVVVESTAGSTRQTIGGKRSNETIYRFASSIREATHNSTRFQCRFHHDNVTVTSFSVYPFDYEFVSYYKHIKTMLPPSGDFDRSAFWLNQLLFSCPIPEVFQPLLSSTSSMIESNKRLQPAFYVDLIPIRTPVRKEQSDYLFQSSADESLENRFGKNHFLPPMEHAGRWQNLPVCPRSDDLLPLLGNSNRDQSHLLPSTDTSNEREKPHRLVACTWTSSSYRRRGESFTISDSVERLKEWIQFHLMVGFDHLYIYDNSDLDGNEYPSVLYNVTQSFGTDQVTYHAWPCKICNNNRPGNKNPGVRSSQYAAENSCRTRYGELSDWMAFIDTDEYMVPMKQKEDGEYSWHPVMDEMERKDISIMKFLSSRAKPRIDLSENLKNQSVCTDPEGMNKKTLRLPVEPCVGPMKNKTFLQVFNCEYVRPPKPTRFDRAMKQIYRPSFVLFHFVHYSTVTTDMRSQTEFLRIHPGMDPKRYNRKPHSEEVFLDEMTQGMLVHARSVLPHETRRRSAECRTKSNHNCMIGYLCEDDVEFVDEVHKDNVFHNHDGSFCNCWKNDVIEELLVPKLESLLRSMT